jgi:hypothetical protein
MSANSKLVLWTMTQFDIKWHRRGGPPQNPSNPKYPEGVHLDLSVGAAKTCRVELPYPTKPFLGLLVIVCETCGFKGTITTAGRPDDPRSIRIACKEKV